MVDTALDNNRLRFNKWAQTYEHSLLQWLIFGPVHQAVFRNLPPGFTPSHILDMGCGTGRLLRRMHSKWPVTTLVGIDSAEGMVTRASQLTPAAAIYQAYAEHLPMRDLTQDLVTTTMSFHHWVNQEQGLSEVFRVLSSGGIFVLADTNIGHGHPLSRSQVREALTSAGLLLLSQASLVPYLTITVSKKV